MAVAWLVAVAFGGSMGWMASEEQEWPLVGSVDCDARQVLEQALDDDVLEPYEAHRVASCNRTTALKTGTMGAYTATSNAIEAHQDDPEALVQLAAAAGTHRSGLLGDMVRIALQLEIADALHDAPPGPWQARLATVARHEPGLMPAEDLPVFRAMLTEAILDGPDGDVAIWGRNAVFSTGYLAITPLVQPLLDDLQVALDAPEPKRAVDAVADAWSDSWVPDMGYVSVIRDGIDDEAELRDQWQQLLKGSGSRQ